MTSRLAARLADGEFVVTAEACPPKGSDCAQFIETARFLATHVDALNVTDNQGANMRLSPLAAAAILVREGIEPVMQLTCRDRNRLAFQADLLGAAAMGVENVLILSGDGIRCGDHPEGKQVFDLDSVQALRVVEGMNRGTDMTGRKLNAVCSFYAGAAAAPEAEPQELAMLKVRKKIAAGARFLQTQAIFRPERLEALVSAVRPHDVKVIAGIFLLKSAGMARFVNRNIPGLTVPDDMIRRLEEAADPITEGVAIARETAAACAGVCDGLHLMTLGREDLVPEILKGTRSRRTTER